jgi:hypothetical protein
VTERKSRLCCRGDQQEEGIDFQEVHAPTAAANTTRMVIAEAAYRDMHVHQVDVKAAFLNAPLQEELYMRPSKGLPQKEGKVWRLHKAIYGLRQAAHAWHVTLTTELAKYGFTPCLTDPCLFIKRQCDTFTFILVYVDDMLIGGEYPDVLAVIEQLAQSFKIKNLGVAYHFLGFLIHRDEYGIRLSQEQYTNIVLKRFGYEKSHGKRTPFNEGTAKECAVRCQCKSAEKYKQNF